MAEPVKERGMAHTNRKQAGMTLVELMIAMVVLAVGMAGVLLMITSGIASNNRNRYGRNEHLAISDGSHRVKAGRIESDYYPAGLPSGGARWAPELADQHGRGRGPCGGGCADYQPLGWRQREH
jgi:prepilin-type N-terminal cleavage/methylation domain-containing protein